MGEIADLHSGDGGIGEAGKPGKSKLTLVPLIFLIYFEVSGGPFGEELAVKAAGPLFALVGFVVFPFVWSIPEALITAELATAYPGNGGYVIWAWEAFGPLWGFLMGWWKWISGVINNAAYPVLCLDYLRVVVSQFAGGPLRDGGIFLYTILLGYLNYTGLTIVGWTAVTLGVVSLLPFLLMALIAIPRIEPRRWLVGDEGGANWSLFFNTLFWNLNFWDNASTLAGEVEEPRRTFPRALLSAGVVTCLGYILPLLAATGALELKRELWSDGYLAEAAGLIGGAWLKYWIELAAVLSTVGLFEAQLSSASFQLLGMAEIGMLPSAMARRSSHNTPYLGILVSACGTLLISYMSFADIISTANFLYSCGMLLEFAAFVWLRRKRPALERPYAVPLGIPGLICMCAVPVGFLVVVMALAKPVVYVLSASVTAVGLLSYFFLNFCKAKNWIEFRLEEDGRTNEFQSARGDSTEVEAPLLQP